MKYLKFLVLLICSCSVFAATFNLVGSDRDGQGNLICRYSNGETINMGQSWSPCPTSISR